MCRGACVVRAPELLGRHAWSIPLGLEITPPLPLVPLHTSPRALHACKVCMHALPASLCLCALRAASHPTADPCAPPTIACRSNVPSFVTVPDLNKVRVIWCGFV